MVKYQYTVYTHTYNSVTCFTVKSSVLHFIHMPHCPSRPPLHFNSICMSKAAESLRGNQPQRHRLRAQCLTGATEGSSAYGESESHSLYRSPMGGEESSYSNSVENACTHGGSVTHSWDNKYHGKSRRTTGKVRPAHGFLYSPLPPTWIIPPKKPMNVSLCFRGGLFECLNRCGMEGWMGSIGPEGKADGVKWCGAMGGTLWKAGLNWNT